MLFCTKTNFVHSYGLHFNIKTIWCLSCIETWIPKFIVVDTRLACRYPFDGKIPNLHKHVVFWDFYSYVRNYRLDVFGQRLFGQFY